jgi:RNA polymerase sigma factor (sigma-70 family)
MQLKELYHKFAIMVFNVALQYVQNDEDAEEITQDVFIKINDKLNTFEQKSDIKTWIYRITINKSLDFLKANKTNKRWFFINALKINQKTKIEVVDFNHPGVQLEEKEAMEQLFVSINKLPNNQKTSIILLKIEQLSQAEAAQIMNISVKALESLFQRAKKNLENIINQNP